MNEPYSKFEGSVDISVVDLADAEEAFFPAEHTSKQCNVVAATFCASDSTRSGDEIKALALVSTLASVSCTLEPKASSLHEYVDNRGDASLCTGKDSILLCHRVNEEQSCLFTVVKLDEEYPETVRHVIAFGAKRAASNMNSERQIKTS